MTDATFAVANPSDSILMSLARAALAPGTSGGVAAWPKLDLHDPAQRQFGDYELLEELGRGGMGVVYRARQKSLERNVAIKFIAEWFTDSTNVVRFLAEARAAAKLLHPNIVPVHEVGSIEGVHYFSMPLIEGRSLASLLDDGPLSTDVVIRLLLKLCEAIDYAHRLGLLHLDLKPANVLIDARDEPLIADFGLARHMDDRGGVDAQEVSGTPSFMAPEQILIKQYRLTRATDIYALGAILYLCLTGESPHGEGEADDVLRRAVAGRVRHPRELNPKIARDLDAICMKCLELQPSDRYKTAAELADDLRRVRDGLPVSVRRISFTERAQRWFRREPRLATAVVVATLTLLIGAAATTWQWKEAAAARDRASIASELGAHLFAYQGDNDKRADDMIAWLRKRVPGDEERQASVLTAFATSVDAESRDKMEGLLLRIIEVLGADYRRQMIQALQAGSDPNRHIYSALLAWNDEHESDAPEQFAAFVQSAIAAQPDDLFTWNVAAVYCPEGKNGAHCLYPQAAETLVRLDPDNMYHWLLLLMQSSDAQQSRVALHQAAQRSRFEDYTNATFAAYPKAFDAANVRAPRLLASPAQLLAPNERPETSIALLSTASFPLAAWQRLTRVCGTNAGAPTVTDPEILADCLAVGKRLMSSDSNRAILTQMIGVALVRSLAKDTPLAEEAKQKRRAYRYLVAMTDKLAPSQRVGYSSARFLRDMADLGELGAWRRRVEYFGMPGQPPADWQPDDPTTLLTGRERNENLAAVIRTGKQLVAESKFTEAAASLGPQETAIRTYFTSDNGEIWRVPGYLLTLGKARAALGQYAAARANLAEAFNGFRSHGPAYNEYARDCAHALVDLYIAWNIAESGKGYDASAVEWSQKLAGLEAEKDNQP